MAKQTQFILNQKLITTSVPDGMVLLDFLRSKRLTGTKEGCREGDCGACSVLIGELVNGAVRYKVVNSCLLPMGSLAGKHVVTIEGLSGTTTPIQHAFIAENASQCGFCTPGFIIALTGYFLTATVINMNDAIHALDGNICRCTGYVSIKRAVDRVCKILTQHDPPDRIQSLIASGIIPEYFKTIPQQLAATLRAPFNESQGAPLVAGGTDLFVQIPDVLENKLLRFLPRADHPVMEQDGLCIIDAATTVTELSQSELLQKLFPRLNDFISLISSTPIRNRATIAGNIVNASPIGDLSIFFLALDASLVLSKNNVQRQIKLRDFFLGYKNIDLAAGEIITTVHFSIDKPFQFSFEKVSKRRHLDIASVNSAILLQLSDGFIENIHLSAGGVAPIPLYLTKTSSFLRGKKITGEIIEEAIRIADSEISPITDIRGSADYKRILLCRLLLAHFITLVPDLDVSEVTL